MKTVTFAEFVPGMLLYPLARVNPSFKRNLEEYVLLERKVEAGTEPFWGNRPAMWFVELAYAHYGLSGISMEGREDELWEVIEDQATLDMVREYLKNGLNESRDRLDKLEMLVDANL